MRPLVAVCCTFLLFWASLLLIPSSAEVDARALAFFPAEFLQDTKELTWWFDLLSALRTVATPVLLCALLLSPLGLRWQRWWERRSIVAESVVIMVVVTGGQIALHITQLVLAQLVRTSTDHGGRAWPDSLWVALSTATSTWQRDVLVGLAMLILLRKLPRAWVVVVAVVTISRLVAVNWLDEPLDSPGIPLTALPPPLSERTPPLIELVRSAGVSPDIVLLIEDPNPLGQSGWTGGVGSSVCIGLHAGFAESAPFPAVAETLAHEIGHVIARDIERDIAVDILVAVAMLAFMAWALRRSGVLGARPSVVWPFFVLLGLTTDAAGELVKNPYNAWKETRADDIAVELVGSDAAVESAVFSATRRRADPTRSFWQMLRRPYPSDLQRIERAIAHEGPALRGILRPTVLEDFGTPSPR